MSARPTVNVVDSGEQVALPDVFTAPIRPDLVSAVHTGVAKNARQAYAVSPKAGHQTAAESWGTGRAVSRIPRVPGGGTHRAGQGAFGNMCRGGRMFAPTHTWRRWHRKVNIKQKRYAVCSALAASAVPALVMARGHQVSNVAEIPLVLSDSTEGLTKTAKAVAALEAAGAIDDVNRCKASRNLRKGKGKMRNRRYVMKKGPLVIYANDEGITKAFRNIPSVDLCAVDKLNLLQLAPGGHLGRFCIFTKAAFQKLDSIFGTKTTESEQKKGWKVPSGMMTNSDLTRLINSDEVQSIVNPPKENKKRYGVKKNPLKNFGAMVKLNPYAQTLKRNQLLSEAAAKGKTKSKPKRDPKAVEAGKKFLAKMKVESDYQGELFENFDAWLKQAKKEPN